MSKVRSYNRTHLRAWAFDLEKQGHISCFFQKCPFIAFDIPEIISHYRNCKGDSVYEFSCQYCQKATDKLYKLHNHIIMSHEAESLSLPEEVAYQFKEDDAERIQEIPKVMKDVWRLFLEIKGYLKCLIPICRYITDNTTEMEVHYLKCVGVPTSFDLQYSCDICNGTNSDPSVIARHRETCHSSHLQQYGFNLISLQLRHTWQKELQDYRFAKCITTGCRYASRGMIDMKRHYTYCRGPLPERYVLCETCGLWWENVKVKNDHAREQHSMPKPEQCSQPREEDQIHQECDRAPVRKKRIRKVSKKQTQEIEQDSNVATVKVVSDCGMSWQMNISGVQQPSLIDFSFDGIHERTFANSMTLLESSAALRHFYHRHSVIKERKTAEYNGIQKIKKSKDRRRKLKGARVNRRKRSRVQGKRESLSNVRKKSLKKSLPHSAWNDSHPMNRRSRTRKPVVMESEAEVSTSPITNGSGDGSAGNRTESNDPNPGRRLVTYPGCIRQSVTSAAVWPLLLANQLNSHVDDEISIRDFNNMSPHTVELSFDRECLMEENPNESVEIQDLLVDFKSIDTDYPYIDLSDEPLKGSPEPDPSLSKGPIEKLLNCFIENNSMLSTSNKKKFPGFDDKSDFRNINKLFDFEFFFHRIGVSFTVCPLYDTIRKRAGDSSRQTDLRNEETPPGDDSEPVRRRGRPRRKVIPESEAETVDGQEEDSSLAKVDEIEDQDSVDAGTESPVPGQRRSRRKRGRASVKKDESEADVGDNQDSSLDTSVSDQPVTTKRRKALPYDDIRVNYFTKLKNPNDEVKCGVCSETMTAKEYQSRHLQRHSYICWLEGEPPMDNEDEDVLARYLYRVYVKGKNVIFTCEKCNETKKSAKGFVTHRALCGKTGAEVDQVMAKCGLCGRVVMPYCLESHMMAKHSKRSDEDETDESQGRKVRLAASKCLKTLSSITAKPEYHTPLRGGKQEPDTPSYNSENEGDGDGSFEDDPLYSVVKRRTTKILKTLWGTSLKADQEAKCMVRGCEYSTNRMKSIIRHYQSCTVEPLEYRCRECTFQSFSREVILKHIKTNHDDVTDDKKVVAKVPKNGATICGIPFVTQAESRLSSTCSFFYEAISWTYDLRKKCLATDALYGSCDFKSEDWTPLDAAEAKPYLPRQSKSMKFFVGKTVEQKEWNIVQTFEAHRGSDDTITTLFCGGPLSSMAWAPIEGPQQYLALSTDLSMDQPRTAKDVSPAPGCVQIWSAMKNIESTEPQDIKLEYILCHDEGSRAWDMKWCPGGTQNERRMGMLALATSSGVIPVYSLPWPALLPDLGRRIKTFKPNPVFGLILDSERAQCTTVSWSQVKPHRILAAGFTNGVVALWDLTQESQLLKRANNLLPFKVFNAHSHIVTSVSLSPTSEEHLMTSARDKIIKCWDVKDTTCPQSQNHRGTAMDVDWVYSWMSSALIIDSISSSYTSTTVLLYPYRYVAHQTNMCCGTLDSTPLGLSVNSWLNAILTSYDNGQVSLVFARNQVGPRDDRKKFVKAIIQPELHDFRPSNMDCNTYAKASEKFGVTFFTDTLADHSQRLKRNPPNPINAYPILAANKVAWNPNPGSALNFAVGYQSGFVLITDILLTQTDQKLMNNAFASILVKREITTEKIGQ